MGALSMASSVAISQAMRSLLAKIPTSGQRFMPAHGKQSHSGTTSMAKFMNPTLPFSKHFMAPRAASPWAIMALGK